MSRSSNNKLLLDSNVFLRFWMDGFSTTQGFLSKISGYDFRILVPKLVLREIRKKLKISTSELMDKLVKMKLSYEIVNDNKVDLIVESQKIMIHYPDNVHLAVARMENAIMVTYDNLLLKIAELEGVQAYHPDQLLHILT